MMTCCDCGVFSTSCAKWRRCWWVWKAFRASSLVTVALSAIQTLWSRSTTPLESTLQLGKLKNSSNLTQVTGVVVWSCSVFGITLFLWLLSWRARQALPIWGDRCPEEMRNSTRLWIWRDPSLPHDSWQPFYWLRAPLKGGCHCSQLTYCRPLSNDWCGRMSTNYQAAVGSPTL